MKSNRTARVGDTLSLSSRDGCLKRSERLASNSASHVYLEPLSPSLDFPLFLKRLSVILTF